MYKKKLMACIISATLFAGAVNTAHAFVGVDVVKIAARTGDMILEHGEALIEQALEKYSQAQDALESEMIVDTYNNGAANYIARRNKNKTEIQNLEQMERSESQFGHCEDVKIGFSVSEAFCGSSAVSKSISEDRRTYSQISRGDLAESESGAKGSGVKMSGEELERAKEGKKNSHGVSIPSSSGEPDQSDVYYAFKQRMMEHVINLETHSEAGREKDVTNIYATIASELSNPELSDEQLDIEVSKLFIQHPPYVLNSLNGPINNQSILMEEKNRARKEVANNAFIKGIAIKTKGPDDEPSKLLALEIASKIRLSNDAGEYSANSDTFMENLAQQFQSEGGLARSEASMMAIDLNNQLEKYKQLLDIERQLTNYAQISMDQLTR